jgi:hypothetical protein
MRISGWQRLGIVLSVLAFFPLGILIWYLVWSTEAPTTHMLMVIAIDLILIGLGWLVIWGCIAVVRWVSPGFAAQ